MRKTLVTIDGHIGSGAFVVGRKIARMFDWRYFDRARLPRIQGSDDDVEIAVDMVHVDFSDRLWMWIERAASYFAVGAAGDDPLLQGAADMHCPLTWDRNGPSTSEAAYDLGQVAKAGNAVIVHRAGAVELAHNEDVARVGIFANWDERVSRVMHREGITDSVRAENVILEREKAQRDYFFKMHSADPEDPDIYDFVINTSDINLDIATLEVSRYLKKSHDSVPG